MFGRLCFWIGTEPYAGEALALRCEGSDATRCGTGCGEALPIVCDVPCSLAALSQDREDACRGEGM